MNLDIIFNIDYASQGVGLLQYDLPKYIEYIQVGDMSQFQRLIKSLDDEVNCHIWVHPSLAADRVTAGFSSKILLECVPELQRLNIQFLQITRSTGRAEGNQFVDVAKMLDVRKNAKSYTAMELKEILFPVPTETQIEQSKIRERLVDSLKSDLDRVNVRLNLLRSFLKGNVSAEQEWFKTVLASRYWKLFSFPYWNFKSDVLENFLNLSDIGSDLLDTKNLQVSEVIIFDRDSSKWKIDISFFDQVSNRFERSHPDYAERLFIATTLYVVHEVVHKTHNLDSNTVDGIGNFPKIVEEADYQADAIAVLTELSFFIYEKGGIEKLTAKELIGKLLDTIKIAIETTFSFNPIGSSLKMIQVRRVNRYLIWFFHYFKIKSELGKNQSSDELLEKILLLFSVKPVIEITGPAIKSNKERNRTFYDLNSIIHREEVGVMKIDNEIVRMAPTGSLNFQRLYDGLKESDFAKMEDFLERLFAGNRTALK